MLTHILSAARKSSLRRSTLLKPALLLKSALLLAATLGLVAWPIGSATQAASGTWTQTTSGGVWSNVGNWSGGTIANGDTFTADFNTLDITADNTVHLDSARTIGNLTFGDTATGTAAGWLIDNNGNAANILTLGGTSRTITVNALGTGKVAEISAVVAGGSGLTKNGAGTLTLSGNNTYTNTTTVNAGTLNITNRTAAAGSILVLGGSIGLGTGNNFSIGNNEFGVGGASIVNHTAGTISTGTSGPQLQVGRFSSSGNGEYNLSGGTLNIGYTATFVRGVMLGAGTGNSGTFNLSGTGILNVTGSNASLQVGRSTAAPDPAAGSNTTNLFNQTGGTANISILRVGSDTNASGVTSTLSLTGGTFTATTFNLLARGNTNTALIQIGGTADVTLPAFPTNVLGTSSTATIEFDGGTLKNSGTSTNYLGSISSAQIMAGGAKFNTTSGNITITHNLLTHGSSLGGGLTKEGSNTLTLSGNNTYTGDTNVSVGTLALSHASSNNIASSDTIRVASGAFLNVSGLTGGNLVVSPTQTLAGSGTVTGAVTIGGGATISPGDSPGTLFTGAEIWNPAGDYLFEINNATGTAGSDPGWDLLAISGTLTINSSLGNEFNILLTSLDLANAPGSAANFLDTSNYAWLLADATSTISTYTGTDQFLVDTSAFANAFTGTFAVLRGDSVQGGDDSQLYLTYTAQQINVIPEPSTYALALLGLVGLGGVAWRRKRK